MEDYVSLETAKLLKEIGFDIPTERFYNESGTYCCGASAYNWNDDDGEDCSRPTLQMAMKYLREVHKLEIYPYHQYSQDGNKWWFEIVKFPSPVSDYESNAIYATYEEACEEAIKYCLENLI